MDTRQLGRSGLAVSTIGYGAFKIGRNVGTKYATPYDLPDDAAVESLLSALVADGVSYFDTAPAYGVSEERLGRFLRTQSPSLVVSTKVGERFVDGKSSYDFSAAAVRASLLQSAERLGRARLDLVFVHAHGDDLAILRDTEVVTELVAAKRAGFIKAVGFSGKTVAAAQEALSWADVLMVEYHADDRTHDAVMTAAAARGVGVVVKKALASGRLDASTAIPFALAHAAVNSVVVSSLDLGRMRENLALAGAKLTKILPSSRSLADITRNRGTT